MIHVSPNFGLANALAQGLLELPASKQWAKYIAGSKRSFSAHSLEHAAYWTLEYPTDAVHVMADTVMAARQADLAKITTPALFCFNEKDKVVSAKQTRRIIARWGAPIEVEMLVQTPKDDAMGHIMAGDIFSPGQTAPLAARISAWLDGLPTR